MNNRKKKKKKQGKERGREDTRGEEEGKKERIIIHMYMYIGTYPQQEKQSRENSMFLWNSKLSLSV